jgi:phage terminase Nu1 subunit (DNA packaging protein)
MKSIEDEMDALGKNIASLEKRLAELDAKNRALLASYPFAGEHTWEEFETV